MLYLKLCNRTVAPTFVGIVVELFAYWLDKRDDN
ncbi:type I toxin-antitoxin system Fst family toxin [Vagococcus lutrae]|nr:type I toxin-antitoxin system Fst family toxin [Vagococcus lutrae]MDT2802498.1 type I toxin-antitoxin system Fst family toxin [Vagococcus lutrae]